MALTRKALAAMGIESEKIDQIIELHTETVDGLKNEVADLKTKAEQVPDLEKKLQEMEAAKPTEDWEGKFNDLTKRFETYKSEVAAEGAKREKAGLYREMLHSLGIEDKRIDAIMKVTNLDSIEVKDGALENVDELKDAAAKEWEAFVPTLQTRGANVPTPQVQSNTEGANPEVLKRLAERHERLYGKTDETKE